MNTIRNFIPAIIFVVIVIVLGIVMFALSEDGSSTSQAKNDSPIENINTRWYLGADDAPVVIDMYSDFQCPFCAQAALTIDEIHRNYPTKTRIIYHHFPLIASHPLSLDAAKAAEAAGYQNKFWNMHDTIFANQQSLTKDSFREFAQQLELDMNIFDTYMNNTNIEKKILDQLEEGKALGITSTPTFFVNGRKLTGAQPFSVFKSIIEEELSKKGADTLRE